MGWRETPKTANSLHTVTFPLLTELLPGHLCRLWHRQDVKAKAQLFAPRVDAQALVPLYHSSPFTGISTVVVGTSLPGPGLKAESRFLKGKENVRNCELSLFRQQVGNL